MECEDFLQFQDTLKKMRDVDDKIVYLLNSSLPTASFKPEVGPVTACHDLYSRLDTSYSNRSNQINKCIHNSAEHIKLLKSQYENDQDNIDVLKKLKKEQTKLRMLKTEVNIEEVLKERTMKVFNDRCRDFYKPGANVNL